eukprot:snap_masked-scaffold_8-processed-gene-5.33-mRNA-1 protein AED:1.00 eAED:1.00 QI:0/-1/0/0/-1/1/1/0/90
MKKASRKAHRLKSMESALKCAKWHTCLETPGKRGKTKLARNGKRNEKVIREERVSAVVPDQPGLAFNTPGNPILIPILFSINLTKTVRNR